MELQEMTSGYLDEFLEQHRRVSQNAAKWKWGDGIELEVTGYLCSEVPAADLVSSVRAIVLKEDHVLVMRNPGGAHILPGGRVEKGEELEETLQRELLEEAGLGIDARSQTTRSRPGSSLSMRFAGWL